MIINEGKVRFRNWETYYRIADSEQADQVPLLALHGGPGTPHNYLQHLDELATAHGRTVIYYDQIGCGQSSRVENADGDFWTIDLFVEELDNLDNELKLEKFDLLGQSWGGMLALAWIIQKQPSSVHKLILSGTPVSIPLWQQEIDSLREDLPVDMQQVLNECERTGNWDFPEMTAINDLFGARYAFNSEPSPELIGALQGSNGEIFAAMQGPNDFAMTSSLRDIDFIADLPRITIPTLVLSGTRDECTPLTAKTTYDGLPNAEWILVPGFSSILTGADCLSLYAI